eukprot:CAMPEP_0202891508 /NCGR_PEP_ID=MMETSP1392-20130828/1552_1 /ASSEMBLY_ACC=CAM_ASM_000868 /TAXON_ID=225041 /ORGANISM="Chlamydomonas chlamydogama, Strain SAG 11-48b" /LENGTH=439 /DNA_ID=CAMNT_0049575287 /DNA_START=181 /DNA_END=1500 /DNA_ORIENTATION=-
MAEGLVQHTEKQPGSPNGVKAKCIRWYQDPVVRLYIKCGLLIAAWYTLSTALSSYNKLLLGKNHGIFGKAFPAPLFMSAVQFALQCVLAKIVFQLRIVERTAQALQWKDWARSLLPNGLCTGMDIGLSNMSLVYITLSFYTMCKSTTPLYLLLFAFIWKVEKPTWQLGGIVTIISIGLALLVAGETQFDATGFALVMVASCLSGLRFMLTQVFLHGNHHQAALGNTLEMVEGLTPVMSVTVLVVSLAVEKLWVVLPASPYFHGLSHVCITLGLMFLGALLAFLMVWAEYQVIQETSALTFMVAGTCKEVVAVLAAVLIFHDEFIAINAVGLVVVLAGVGLFNWYKYQKMKQTPSSPYRTTHRGEGEGDGGEEGMSSAVLEMEPLMKDSKATNGNTPHAEREERHSPGLPVSTRFNTTRYIDRDSLDHERQPLVASDKIQ